MSHKTRLARELRDKLGAHLFDLQSHFVTHPEMAAQVNTFRSADLEKLLLSLGVPENIIVVDNVDFLINVWTPHHKRDFVAMLDLRLRTSITDKTFIFMMQPDQTITSQTLTNTQG